MTQFAPQFSDVQVGHVLPALQLPAVDRTMLALYAGASGDHNQIHIDIDFARRARMPDVFAHGMLSAAYLGRLLTLWVPRRNCAASRCASSASPRSVTCRT